MRYTDIKRHLQPYMIVSRRRTTINHAFASAVAPCDEYSDARVREAIWQLGQNPDDELECVYCGAVAETWDHVYATVKDSQFSGHGHRIGNLLPCCKPCNSAKGNKAWDVFLGSIDISSHERGNRSAKIAAYLAKHHVLDSTPTEDPDYAELSRIKAEVISLLARADELAHKIRCRNAASYLDPAKSVALSNAGVDRAGRVDADKS